LSEKGFLQIVFVSEKGYLEVCRNSWTWGWT